MTGYLEFLLNNTGIYLEFFLTQEYKARIAPLKKWSSFSGATSPNESRGIQRINNHPLESSKDPENLTLSGILWIPRQL